MAKKKKENMDEVLLEKKLKEVKGKLDELIKKDIVESSLGSNEIEFEIGFEKYKVVKPSYKDKQETYKQRALKYTELLTATDNKGNYIYKSEDDLKKIYKKRGIDIDEMENKIKAIDNKINNYKIKIGEALTKDKPDKELELFKQEIEKLFEEKKELTLKKTTLLETSIESQSLVYALSYLTYLITYKFVDGKWQRAWKTFEEFLNTPEDVINVISFYASLVIDIQNDLLNL